MNPPIGSFTTWTAHAGGVDKPQAFRQRSGQVILPRTADWWEATRELRERFDVEPQKAAPIS